MHKLKAYMCSYAHAYTFLYKHTQAYTFLYKHIQMILDGGCRTVDHPSI